MYCNCDDPYVSAFFEYFTKNFECLGLKKLITTCYKSKQMDLFSQNDSEQAIKLEYTGDALNSMPTPDDIGVTHLKGDGDFRSEECIGILNEADIVVTNPPFSLFSEYVAQLSSFDKKFIIIGHLIRSRSRRAPGPAQYNAQQQEMIFSRRIGGKAFLTETLLCFRRKLICLLSRR